MKAKYITGVLFAASAMFVLSCSEDETLDSNSKPIITAIETGSAEVTAITADLYGKVTGLNGLASSSYAVGAYLSSEENPEETGKKVNGSLESDGQIKVSLEGLETNKTYYYKVFVTLQNTVTKTAANSASFTTIGATVTNLDPTDITMATCTVKAAAQGIAGVESELKSGFFFSLNEDKDELKNGLNISAGDVASSISLPVSGLLPNTTYYCMPYLNMGSGYVFGEVKSFATPAMDQAPEFIDLGLSVKWAPYNVGATSEEQAGAKFTWADISGLKTSEDMNDYTYKDNIYSLKDYDVCAATGMGRLPLLEEYKELIMKCSASADVVNGVSGTRYTGPNGNSVFFPSTGLRNGSEVSSIGESGNYRTGTINNKNTDFAYCASFSGGSGEWTTVSHTVALSARGVRATPKPMDTEHLYKTWYLDLRSNGESRYFDGPMYYYGTEDSWETVTDGELLIGDSWSWAPVWKDNEWIADKKYYGAMTLAKDGTVKVVDSDDKILFDGTFIIDEVNRTISLKNAEILHLPNYHDIVTNWSNDLKILSLTEGGMQIAVLRDNSNEGPCSLSFNFVPRNEPGDINISLLYQSWNLDLDKDGISRSFDGPVYYYGMGDSWFTVNNDFDATDSWSWSPKWSDNTWIVEANDFGVMTFNQDGTVRVVDVENNIEHNGTFTVDMESRTITLEGAKILHPGKFDAIVTNWSEKLRILSLTDQGLQIAVVRDNDPNEGKAQLAFNFIPNIPAYETSICLYDGNEWTNYATFIKPIEGKQYSVTCEGSRNAGQVYILDVKGFVADNKNSIITIDKIVADGNEVKFDANKMKYGDLEGNGNYRIEIFNIWGAGTANDSPFGDGGQKDSEEALAFNESFTVYLSVKKLDASLKFNLGMTGSDWGWVDTNIMATPNQGNIFVGDYSIRFETDTYKEANMINVIDLESIVKLFPNVKATLKEVLIDGEPVTFDNEKIKYGDLETNGNYRIELYNIYGETGNDNPFGEVVMNGDTKLAKTLVCEKSLEVKFSVDSLF